MPLLVSNTYETLDDLMHDVLKDLLDQPITVNASRGNSSEVIGTTLNLSNPRARLSRSENRGTIFSALGEFLWYLSGTNELQFITHYIKKYEEETEDNLTVHGGYGPRLFNYQNNCNQVDNVIQLLRNRPSSRKAVIQLLDPRDLAENHKEFPCTCTLQFFIRSEKIHMHTTMRSNDAFMGLPHDIFAFTMLQELIAKTLNKGVGHYYHSVGSLHLYDDKFKRAQQYVDEGYHEIIAIMPSMPDGDPWPAINQLLEVEKLIRSDASVDVLNLDWHPYWKDLALILKIYSLFVKGAQADIRPYRDALNETYHVFVDKKLDL